MKKVVLKYGVFAILICMLAGVFWMLDSFKLGSRTSVQVFVLTEHTCRAYAMPAPGFSPLAGDTLLLKSTAGGDLTMVVDTVWQEPSHLALTLHLPASSPGFGRLLHGDHYTPGYISTGKVRLKELVFKRVKAL